MSIGRLYRLMVPAGSRRDRALWMGWLAVRKLREGPRPWWRAVRAGTFQLLPPRAQRALLRFAGRTIDSGAVAAVAPAQGVEVPGLVSVVLPVHQQADLLGDAVASVLAQDVPLELIVVDDGSGPEVQQVLQRFRHDPRVRILRQENRGLPRALDAGFAAARGEFWTWTSADNVLLPGMLGSLVAALRARGDVAMLYADYELIDDAGRPVRGTDFRVQSRRGPDDPVVRLPRDPSNLAVVQDNFVGPCFLYRGAAGRLLGAHHPEMGLEDYDYWLRMQRCFGLAHVGGDEVLYRYRVHERSLSARGRELRLLERGRALLAEERERAAWHREPVVLVADGEGRAWLGAHAPAAAAGALADGWPQPQENAPKTLAIVGPETARTLGPVPPHAAIAVACTDPAGVYRAAPALGGPAVVASAADAAVAARLAVFTRAVVVPPEDGAAARASSGADALAPLTAVCSERTWQAARWPSAAIARPPCSPAPVEDGALRVLLQADGFTRGGLERVVLDLATCFRARGVEVALLALGQQGPAVDEAAALGVRVLDAATARTAGDYADLLARERIDVVHAHESIAFAAVAAARGIPFVQVVHNAYAWFLPERRDAYRAADAHTAAWVAVSAQALAYADLRLGIDVGKALVVQNGVAAAPPQPAGARDELRARWGIGGDEFAFVQVAALHPPKAQHIAVRALGKLRARGVAAKIVFVGAPLDGFYARSLAADADRLGIAQHAVFAGQQADVAACLAAADAFLLPSFLEGCSLAVLEALHHGLPLVLADVGAACEQLRLGRGALVAPPYGSVLALDWTSLPRVFEGDHDDYVERLADAMAGVAAQGRVRATPADLAAIGRDRMTDRHLWLCRWLRQGGSPAGARALLRGGP